MVAVHRYVREENCEVLIVPAVVFASRSLLASSIASSAASLCPALGLPALLLSCRLLGRGSPQRVPLGPPSRRFEVCLRPGCGRERQCVHAKALKDFSAATVSERPALQLTC